MKLKRVELKQFKGINEKVVDFADFTKIVGQNGTGKTTIADAYFWALSNKDYGLNDNPNIRPIDKDMDATIPTVSLVFDIDGVELTYTKSQKCNVSKDGKISLVNSYEINSVPKTERDAKEDLLIKGIDLDKLLILSHPGVFVKDINDKKVRDDRRTILFGMVNDITDYDLAAQMGLDSLTKLLTDYKSEEIVAMQNATIRKCKEEYGKDGEIIDAKIIAKEQTKVEVDVAALTAERDKLKAELTANEEKQKDVSKAFDDVTAKKKEIAELKGKAQALIDNSNKDIVDKKRELTIQLENLTNSNSLTINKIDIAKKKIEQNNNLIADCRETIDKARNDYKAVREKVFDGATHCPVCGKKFDDNKIEKAKMNFEEEKKKNIENITKIGNTAKEQMEHYQDMNNVLVSDIEKFTKEFADNNAIINELNKKLEDINNAEQPLPNGYVELMAEIDEKEKALPDTNTWVVDDLQTEHRAIQAKLDDVSQNMAKVDLNARIDNQIKELQDKKIDLAQSKANAEKVLYELSQVQQKKNELAEESVNSHFYIVKFKLFDVQKNGEIKDACIPTIDGKAFVDCNTALRTLAEIDIINGLQKYYGVNYPLFLDEAEHLTRNTMDRVKPNSQFIAMACTEDAELKVES